MGDGFLLVYHGWQRGCRVKESRQSSGEGWRLGGLRNGSKWVEQITATHGGYVCNSNLMHASDAEDHVAQRMENSTNSEGGQ